MDPLLDFSYLPYIAENNEQADQLFYGSGIIPATIKETLKKHNIHALGFYELEFRGLTNSKHTVKTPAEMKGLKLRVPVPARSKDSSKRSNPKPYPFLCRSCTPHCSKALLTGRITA